MSENNLKGKFTPRSATSNINPLLRAAGAGFPFETDQSPVLVPVSLNNAPDDTEPVHSEPATLDSSSVPIFHPTSLNSPRSSHPTTTPITSTPTPTTSTPPTQSYSSKLASYFPGVTTAFSQLSHTLTGTSAPTATPTPAQSATLGSASVLSPAPPPTTVTPNPPLTSTNLPVNNHPSSYSSLPPPSSIDVFSSVPLTPLSGHYASNIPPLNDKSSNVSLHQSGAPLFTPLNPTSSHLSSTSSLPNFTSTLNPTPSGPPSASTSSIPSASSVPFYPPPPATSNLLPSPPLTSPVPPTTPQDGGSGYRLNSKGLKRPTYAPVPGLGTTPVAPVPTMAPPVLASPDLSDYMVVESTHSTYDPMTQIVANEACTPTPETTEVYREVYHHWFYKKLVDSKGVWQPLSMPDSQNIEAAFLNPSTNQVVPTDGGRYDVTIASRQRQAVYWKEDPTEVRRCSWFYKASLESRYIPYEENVCDLLEREYREAMSSNQWHKTIPLENGEEVIMYSAKVVVHHIKPDLRLTDFAWDSSSEQSIKPRIVSRGLENFDISEGEPEQIDHLLFLVHGIGSFCDLKFRPVVEVVDDFRSISLGLVASHFKSATDSGTLGRVEMLPISWHEALHSEESGIDKKLKAITLPSIPKLRYFTNDTLLDVLFYTSPVYCERIITAVCKEMNRLYDLFLSRNPGYDGGVSMGGHSLGSLILFDLLSHQKPVSNLNSNLNDSKDTDTDDEGPTPHGKLTKGISYISIPSEGTSVPFIKYPQLTFQPRIFFAFGSPTGMFVNVRGIDSLGEHFVFPTCPKFLNIFHPFDPVAYRIEPLIVPSMEHVSPVVIPHHKGRKRMHLELKDTLEYMGTALKQKLYDSMKNTWNKVSHLAMLNKTDDATHVTQALEEQLLPQNLDPAAAFTEPTQEFEPGRTVGKINGGNRVDYVLQEAPLESFNEYLFALSSHVCYWESNDTMLLVLKEIYAGLGVSADSQVPQNILPFDMDETAEAMEVTQGPVLGTAPPMRTL